MASVHDVAKEAGVSIATVSRVFNNKAVTKATVEKVRQAAEKLNYVPHLGARSLRNSRTDTIGVVLPDMHGEFFSELVRGVDVVARKLGLHLLISCSHDNLDEITIALSAMRGKVDGIIIMSPLINDETLAKYIPKEISVVVLGGDKNNNLFPTVNLDNQLGAMMMTEHLLDEGYQRICLISGPSCNVDSEERKRGYLSAMENSLGNKQIDIIEGDFSEESGYKAGKSIVSRKIKPQAVFALNDAMALGCLCAFNEHGISVPEEIALAGFDDIPISRFIQPSLSTVRVPIADMGSKSLELLLEIMKNEKAANLKSEFEFIPSLIIRKSTRCTNHS